MIYLIFESQESAELALTQIDNKVRSLIQNYNPQAIDDQGNIIPRNAASGELMPDATATSTWAIPQQRVDGKWCFPKLLGSYHPLFAGVDFLEGVTDYSEEEYNSDWFSVEGL